MPFEMSAHRVDVADVRPANGGDGDRFHGARPPQQRQCVVHRTRRLPAVVPGNHDARAERILTPALRDHEHRATALHGCLVGNLQRSGRLRIDGNDGQIDVAAVRRHDLVTRTVQHAPIGVAYCRGRVAEDGFGETFQLTGVLELSLEQAAAVSYLAGSRNAQIVSHVQADQVRAVCQRELGSEPHAGRAGVGVVDFHQNGCQIHRAPRYRVRCLGTI